MSGFATRARMGSAKIGTASPRARATKGSTRPDGSGRSRVRRIRASTSRSSQQLRAFAAPTTAAVPRIAIAARAGADRPGGEGDAARGGQDDEPGEPWLREEEQVLPVLERGGGDPDWRGCDAHRHACLVSHGSTGGQRPVGASDGLPRPRAHGRRRPAPPWRRRRPGFGRDLARFRAPALFVTVLASGAATLALAYR